MQIGIRKWLFSVATVVSLICMALPMMAEEETAPDAAGVAVVNGSIIHRNDLDGQLNIMRQQYAARGQVLNDSELSTLRDQILESLINQELIYQESQKKGTRVEEGTVKQEMEGMKNRFPSEEEFKYALTQTGLTEATLELQTERDLVIRKFIDSQFAIGTVVSDEEVKAFYESHPDSFKQPEEVQASHILIKVDSQADESQKMAARKEIEGIQLKVQKGEDFGALAREFSQGPSSTKGGDLGYFRRGQMVKPFEDMAFSLAPGEVGPIVETQFGYHLIKVTGKRPGSVIAYDDVKDKVQKFLEEQKVQEKVNTYIKEIKGKAKIEKL